MGTRGAVGFRINKEDKVTYNHSDSYPHGLGQDVLDFIKNNTLEDMKRAAYNLMMVNEEVEPTEQQIKECEPWTNTSVSKQSVKDWYCLLRNAQGNLNAYIDGLKYMNDGRDFLLDSLFCEYAYVINMDTQELEFYSGFNKKALVRKGRYANKQADKGRPNDYYGVALLFKTPLTEIQNANKEQISQLISKMDKKAESFYNNQEKELKKVKAPKI